MGEGNRIRRSVTAGAAAVCLAALAAAGPAPADTPSDDAAAAVHQLRIYQVPRENRDVFHERFRDHAARIMARYGFNIVAMWETEFEDGVEFVYLLEWPDEETMTARWEAFMSDEEWAAIKRQTGRAHGTFVEGIEDRTLRPTDYSPRTRLGDRRGG